MLLRSIADHPRCARSQVLLHVPPANGCSRSDHVVQHTRVLDALTSTKIASVVLGTSQVFSAQVTAHLMQNELYGLSSRAIASVVCALPLLWLRAYAHGPFLSLSLTRTLPPSPSSSHSASHPSRHLDQHPTQHLNHCTPPHSSSSSSTSWLSRSCQIGSHSLR
jgi:hypothetical protein